MSRFADQIRGAIRGRHPLIYLHTSEEDRACEELKALAGECFAGGSVRTWSCIEGLVPAPKDGDTRDPVAALQHIIASPEPGFYAMKDLPAFLGDPRVVRALRDAYHALARDFKSCVVLVSAAAELPETLDKELCYVALDVPTSAQMLAKTLEIEAQYPGVALGPELHSKIVLALRGLTLKEVEHVMRRVFSGGGASGKDVLDEIFAEKRTLARRSGFLEFVPLKFDINRVGGLEIVKAWAAKRKNLFNEETVKAGIPIPKGVLIMGVSGCGKSMLAKAIAGLWQVPLFRLDMSLVFSGVYGSPEATFHRALRTIEAVAPVVLWIDEMESALGTPKDVASPQSMTFSAFLTWMQEKPPLVFVAATANRIETLPAEVIRKGRFDQVFFCDLPGEDERAEIVKIHLELNGIPPEDIDLDRVVYNTEGWSGAEIEQAVIAARIDALEGGRATATEDIVRHANSMVPLSKTMSEQIKAIRGWAFHRATRASKPAPPGSKARRSPAA